MIKNVFLFIFFISFRASYSQSNDYSESWNELLLNNREIALNKFEKRYSNIEEVEKLIFNQIIKSENGYLTSDELFVDKLLEYNDFEYYLYALWNEDFLFKNYLKSGFNGATRKILDKAINKKIKEPTISQALYYLKAVQSREVRDLISYQRYIDKIPSIRKWQFCGVFENLNQSGYDITYKPEIVPISKEDFNANSNGFVNWYVPVGFEKEAYQYFSNHDEYGSGVHYAQTFVESTNEKRIILRLGNSSAFKVWLNDILVFESIKDITTDLDAFNIELTLPKGNNRLLIKNVESGSGSAFVAKITNVLGFEIPDLIFKNSYSQYNKSTLKEINPSLITNVIESYFIEKLKKSPDNFLYTYCLVKTYLRNSKYGKAKELLIPLINKYPKSSFLRKQLIFCYSYEEDYTSVQKLKDNMVLDDENYYLSLLYKFQDQKELARLDIVELEKFLTKFAKVTDYQILKLSADFMYNLRKSDKIALKRNLDSIMSISKDWVFMKRTYAPIYSDVVSDNNRTVSILEDLNAEYLDYATINLLANKYEKLDRKDDVIDLYKKNHKIFTKENFSSIDIIEKLHKYEKYKESIKYIEKAIENFPYSFTMLKLMGDALLQTGKKKEAIEFYKKSLEHDSGNSKLRKKIDDLTNQKDLVEEVHIKKAYAYIDNNRGKKIENNYGYNILLDEATIILYPEGGAKNRYTNIYEITSESGINSFKEYNLNLSGSYKIIKSEIIKANKSIVSADKRSSSFVFKGLEIGDVIHLDYETESTGAGRFYKDYTDYYQFDSFHPCTKTSYSILVPNNIKLFYEVANGELDYTKEQKGIYTKHTWLLNNHLGIDREESYMPSNVDFVRYLHISTISSWSRIAFWYSDLVRSQKEYNMEVENVFKNLFPNGIVNISEEERVKRIYYYIMNNFNYSSVSFRQSGFLPQKPSKTINTKLGDCKDFSTLFVTLAEKANLNSNLILVLTNDHGQKSIILPSQDFNHCIVKVNINGKEQFLELTDKNLPFKALPISLINSTGLEIPNKIDTSKEYKLFKIKNVNSIPSQIKRKAKLYVNEDYNLDVETTMSGSINSYYVGVFDDPNYESIKKAVHEDFKGNISSNFVLDTIFNINAKRGIDTLSYFSKINLDKNNNKIGSINIIQLPKLLTAYENSIINSDERKYPIEYTQYENVDSYVTEYEIYIPKDRKFVEIPENQTFKYKNHSYTIEYVLSNANLKVITKSKTDMYNNIEVDEYPKFKEYVNSIIEAKEAYIGFK